MSHRVPRSLSILLLVALIMSCSFGASAAPITGQAGVQGRTEQPGGISIRLANIEFDPLAARGQAVLQQAQLEAAAADAGDNYYLVQFDGPITEARLVALERTGTTVFDYIPDFTFIVRMDAAQRNMVERQSGVRWIGSYLPAFRLRRSLLASAVQIDAFTAAAAASAAGEAGKKRALLDRGASEIIVDLFPGEPLAPVIAAVEGWGGQVSDHSQTEWRSKLRVTLSAERLAELARLPGVRWIDEAPQWQLHNNKGADIMGARTVWNTHGLRGAGQVVAVADTGLDKGSPSAAQLHDDFENGSGASRVAAVFDRVGDGANDVLSGHGTHVAGSVLGNGSKSGSNPAAHSYGPASYPGLAPEATLVFQAVERNSDGALAGLPLDLNQLFAQAAGAGARIHTNSWGSSDAGAYTGNEVSVDEYAWNNKDFTILFSAGNEAMDEGADGVVDRFSMGPPASAKNAITVGASENNRPGGSTPAPGLDATWGAAWARFFTVNPLRDDHVSNNVNGLAAFSSRGPTLDGRIKPDIVAPGTNIISTLSTVATEPSWGSVNGDYTYMGGTSMATPLVAGATALARQFYIEKKGITPSSALLKATLANGATNIAPGQYGGGATQEIGNTRPTNAAGWGRVNLEDSLFPVSPRSMYFTDAKSGLTTGNSRIFNYNVTNSSEPLRVTLAWTDYPGSGPAGGGLVNDLDLHIVGPGGTTYYPNNANPRAATQHLAYDDGNPNDVYSWSAGVRIAVRFTPTQYPADLQLARFFVGAPTSDLPKSFNWYVYEGNSSGPTNVIADGSTTIRNVGWHTVDLAAHTIRINSGDFFIAFELPDSNMVWAYDTSAPIDGRSWEFDGTSWKPYDPEDYLIHAVMTSPPGNTPHDRVNNLQGIDIANPPAGAYQVVVSGYNVARGPQPYALVVSGAVNVPAQVVTKTYLPVVQRTLPVTPGRIDASADTTILSSAADANFGTKTDVTAGYDECIDAPGVWRGLVKFDVSGISANTQVSSARLSVYLIESCDYPDRVRPLTVYRAGGSWSEAGATWNNQPSIQEAYGTVDIPSRTWGRYSIDVTGLVQGWINGTISNDGLWLRSTEEISSESASIGFGARELGSNYVPYLELTYPGVAPAVAEEEPAPPPSTCANSVLDAVGGKWTRACDPK